jgi:hypothetical protein
MLVAFSGSKRHWHLALFVYGEDPEPSASLPLRVVALPQLDPHPVQGRAP